MARIMFVISRMDVGGLEQVLRGLTMGLARGEKPYDVALVCLYERGRLAKGLEEKGIEVYENVMKHKFDLAGLARFITILRNVKPDVLYITGQTLSQAVSLIGSMFVKIPVKVVGFHSHDLIHRPLYRLLIDRFSLYSAERAICVSESQKRHIVINKKLKPEKIKVIHNGVDQNKFKPGPGIDNQGKVIIGAVGSLREEKGFDILMRAAPEVLKRCSLAHFVIVGDGKERTLLERMAKRSGIENNVDFLGERSDVDKIIQSFDIACSSSRIEAFPVAILEYMACGKCVVAASVGGVPEMVKDGVNGVLVKSESPEDLAEKLVRVINNKKMRILMGLEGRKIIEEHFTLDKMIDNYKRFFMEIQK